MPTRRGVLQLIGGGSVLAAGSAGAFALANGPSKSAREAWRVAGLETEYRRRALSYALLAPNPHNRQPWIVRLEGEDALTLYCDLTRRLPATDPFDRQITIGCGAFLELLTIAAAEDGYRAEILAFPEGEPRPRLDARPIAHVRFMAGGAGPDPDFAHILTRRTNREVYEDRHVPEDILARLSAAGNSFGMTATATSDAGLAAKLREITWNAHRIETVTPVTFKESVDLMRIGKAEVNTHRDGIVLEGPVMEFARLAGIVTREKLLDPETAAFRQGLDMYAEKAASARSFAWLNSSDVSRPGELAAGRAYMRFALKAAELGVAVHPWSQSLQEYREMADLHTQIHQLIGAGKRVQMLVRLGYARPVVAAPRKGLDDVLRT